MTSATQNHLRRCFERHIRFANQSPYNHWPTGHSPPTHTHTLKCKSTSTRACAHTPLHVSRHVLETPIVHAIAGSPSADLADKKPALPRGFYAIIVGFSAPRSFDSVRCAPAVSATPRGPKPARAGADGACAHLSVCSRATGGSARLNLNPGAPTYSARLHMQTAQQEERNPE